MRVEVKGSSEPQTSTVNNVTNVDAETLKQRLNRGPMADERGAPEAAEACRAGEKTKDGDRKRNDESQTVDLMPAWHTVRCRCLGVFLPIQTLRRTHVAQAKKSDFAAANLPFEEIELEFLCTLRRRGKKKKKEKRKAEGSGKIAIWGSQ
jgi:hypothetical protein